MVEKSEKNRQLMTDTLSGSDWDRVEPVIEGTDHVYAYRLTRDGGPIWVAWWDHFDDTGDNKSNTSWKSLPSSSYPCRKRRVRINVNKSSTAG
jgi:hypothetical protein